MKDAVSVSQLNKYIKEMFQEDIILNDVLVKGEISNLRESKGNYYFVLKDNFSSIGCIVFPSFSGREVDVKTLSDGIEVIIEGRVSVYEKSGTYSIYVSKVTNSGLGEYYIRLEKLKKELYEKGMFDDIYKKDIPKYSMNIGVVTAKNGAAIKDIERTIYNKNPYANIVLYPALVQGDLAYQSIIDGIIELDKLNLDVIIIGRGGGSIEDLWTFNDERVAYAIFNAKTPIISAVGHEINESISDLVADVRVATPTAAGELATFDYKEFEEDIMNYNLTLNDIITNKLDEAKEKIINKKELLYRLAPKSRIERYKEKLNYANDKINFNINIKIKNVKNEIIKYIEILKSKNILDKIEKGLSYVTDEKDKKITSVKELKKGDILKSRFADGLVFSEVKMIKRS